MHIQGLLQKPFLTNRTPHSAPRPSHGAMFLDPQPTGEHPWPSFVATTVTLVSSLPWRFQTKRIARSPIARKSFVGKWHKSKLQSAPDYRDKQSRAHKAALKSEIFLVMNRSSSAKRSTVKYFSVNFYCSSNVDKLCCSNSWSTSKYKTLKLLEHMDKPPPLEHNSCSNLAYQWLTRRRRDQHS